MLRRHATLGMLVLFATLASTQAGAAADSSTIEAFFEVKLLLRDRVWGREVGVDQWAAGRLAMSRIETDRGERFELREVLETPWTFRWYPTLHEAKLGAAIHVAEPRGEAYGLAHTLEPLVAEKYAAWWDSDAAGVGPPWATETGHFWAGCHERERADPLPANPTYPFHVLGPLAGRLSFDVRAGAIESAQQTLSSPWLADGWSRAIAGETVSGYGYWERKRPRWEPRVYEAFVAALELLSWSATQPHEFQVTAIAELVETLQPRARSTARALPRATPHVVPHGIGEAVELTSSAGDGPGQTRLRVWRKTSGAADELQILVDDQGHERMKVWIRVGYRPLR